MPPAFQPTTPVLPVAAVAIEEFTIKVSARDRSEFSYEPLFRLRETSGKSGATIEEIRFGGEAIGSHCLGPGPLRIPPGGTLETFHTGEVGETWGYCALFGGGTIANPELEVVVYFKDDEGRGGVVRAKGKASG